MKSKLNELRSDSRGVSPVIGVVLMIAVVVILAAVVGAFATGVFGGQQSAPQASFSYDADAGTDGEVVMDGGDTMDAGNLEVTQGSASTDWGSSGTDVTAGDSQPVPSGGSGNIEVVWNDGDGNSAILASFET